MVAAGPGIFSIAPGAPFLSTLADALLDGVLIPDARFRSDPLALSSATIYLPTRRAARALSAVIAERLGGEAVLLPRIVPLGDLEEAEANLMFGDAGLPEDGSLPPEADPMMRRLTLAKLVIEWSRRVREAIVGGAGFLPKRLTDGIASDAQGFMVAGSARDALGLADALGSLIDSLVIHGKTWEDLHALVPDELDDYWKISRNFLEIAAREWPAIRGDGTLDAGERRHRLLLLEAARLTAARPQEPFIVAGSTGSMPATAKLIAAVARLPRGAVVLPGLDRHLSDEDLAVVGETDGGDPGHPQHLLTRLLGVIGVERKDVRPLGEPRPDLAAREACIAEALRPAETTEAWRSRAERLSDEAIVEGLSGVTVVEADDEREEAVAAALCLREALEEPGKTAALITPDRSLAERVRAELARWGITAEDSAGRPLSRSAAGRLALLAAEAFAGDFEAMRLLALLDHPLVRLGLDGATIARGRSALEIGALRGPAPKRGLDGLAAALAAARRADPKRAPRPRRRIGTPDFEAAEAMLEALRAAFAPLAATGARFDLIAAARALEETLGALARDASGEIGLDAAEGGEVLAALFDELAAGFDAQLEGMRADFPAVFEGFMHGRTVSGGAETHPRIRIWGLLEARLLPVDRMILGGLDETVWPPATRTDPFLSRPLARELGLPSPETRIGRTAHDFQQAMGAPEVILTRSGKRGGDPTVPSRFLQRLRAVAGAALDAPHARGDIVLGRARALDRRPVERPIARPAPSPPKDLLPTTLSVTEIDKLRRDPYAIYAKHVLELDRLDELARLPNASEIGTATHDAIADFTEAFPEALPDDAADRLLSYGRKHFSALADRPEFAAFWWPRFKRQAEWYLGWEKARRPGLAEIRPETRGELPFGLPGGGSFVLRGRADRIEVHPGDGFTILDYKTGSPPSNAQVHAGLAPQLTLQAAMALKGGYGTGLGGTVRDLRYVHLQRDGGEDRSVLTIRKETADPNDLAAAHWSQFVKLVDAHVNRGRGFASQLIPKMRKSYDEYDHLARCKEWSASGEGEDAHDGA